MDIPDKPGDILAQPTRARLFELLQQLGRPAGTEELAGQLGLHPNGVRIHLERLQNARLVERRRERLARGRPRDSWSLSADAQPGGDPPSGYAALARWLVRSLSASGARARDLEQSGRQIGRELATAEDTGTASGEQQLFDVLTSLGFQPEREQQKVGRMTYRLRNCPYREAVAERQPLVCGLHRGLTRGLLEVIEPGSRLTAFEPHDAQTAGCMVHIRGLVEAAARQPQLSELP